MSGQPLHGGFIVPWAALGQRCGSGGVVTSNPSPLQAEPEILRAMTQENVEQYYRFADAFNRRDLDAVLAFLDPEVEWAPRSVALEGGRPYLGHDGFRTWWESTFSAFSDYVAEIEDVRDLGEVTLSRLRFRGHGMDSDAPIDEMQWHVVEWRHGSVARLRTLRSEAEALEAVGLSE